MESGEPDLMGTGLGHVAKVKLLIKTLHIRENSPRIEPKTCKNSSTLKIKCKSETIKTKSTKIIKTTSIKKTYNYI